MRKLILQEFLSVDGFASGPQDSVDFIPAATQGDQSFAQRQMAFIDTIDAILLGRVTYKLFSEYWPNVTSGEDKPFADRLNALPKIVFSKTLEHAPWGTWPQATVVNTDAAEEIRRLKGEPGMDMVIWGSISLAQSLMKAGLIDEYHLVLCPVLLGSGRMLFPGDRKSVPVKLLGDRSFDLGAVLLTYTQTGTP
jgi:dihydrofolate reductase